jgi:ubiquinone/menaquinone biosynthesis C-methylase UbiE
MASTAERPTHWLAVFDDAYATRTAPWVIGHRQPAIVTLERGGGRGKVLDVGCGTGEHTIYLSALPQSAPRLPAGRAPSGSDAAHLRQIASDFPRNMRRELVSQPRHLKSAGQR